MNWKSILKKSMKLVGWCLICLVVFILMLFSWFEYDSRSDLKEVRQKLDDAGAPMSADAMMPKPVSEEENAAPLYDELKAYEERHPGIAEAYERLDMLDEEYGVMGIYMFETEDKNFLEVKEVLEAPFFSEYFSIVDRMANRDIYLPELYKSWDPAMIVPEVAQLRQTSMWLLLKAALAVKEERYEEAALRLDQTLQISRHAAQSRLLISLLTSAAIRGMALQAYFADNGTYPETLDELVPEYLETVPVDLFADAPLIYRREQSGYVLYSLGPNMEDDGGRGFEDGWFDKEETADVIWADFGSVLQ